MDQAQPFPATLDAVPAEARISETFPFTPGSIAIGAILGLVGSLVGIASHGAALKVEDLYMPLGCLVGGVLFATWEIWRRTHKTSIAFWGNQIGVYRAGRLDQVAYRSQVMIYQLSIINTIRELFAFGALGFISLIGGAAIVGQNPEMGLPFLGAGIGFTGAFISSMYARIACRHFFVPKGQSTEQVMFTRGAIGRFGI